MAAIVYDGVGGGGNLFVGLKFCFLQRVPSRLRWIEIVESNGGETVKLEKQADLVIADHARKDCPTGSISWTYIQDSAKNGALEEIDDHRAGPAKQIVRDIGSGGPTKKGRTPFSAEDDRVLKKWVVQGEQAGISLKGNELFKQLEEKNSRHPWQSWRDRWIKYVQHQPRPQPGGSPSPSHSPAPVTKANTTIAPHRSDVASSPSPDLRRHDSGSYRGTASSPRPTGKKPSGSVTSVASVPSSAHPWAPKSARGMDFTKKEIQLLMNEYDYIMNIDEDKAFDAWATWSVTYPDHTPQEWRNFFVKQLVPLVENNKRSESKQRHPPSKQSPLPKRTKAQPESAADFDAPEFDITYTPPAMQKKDDSLTEAEFKEDLKAVARQLEQEVDFYPVVCGRPIPLFKLWQVVSSFGGMDEVTGRGLWPNVARQLNFNDFQHSTAAKDLEACYDIILPDFDDARDQYDNVTESQEQALIQKQLFGMASHEIDDDEDKEAEEAQENEAQDEEDFDDDLDAPLASPALVSSNKRHRTDRTSRALSAVAGSYNKRQRTEKGKGKELEIPSTPEEIFNSKQGWSEMPRRSYQPSPLKSTEGIDEDDEKDSIIFKSFGKPDLSFLNPTYRAVEPETQDFHFVSQRDEETEGLEEKKKVQRTATSSIAETQDRSPGYSRNPHDEVSTQSQTQSQRDAELIALYEYHISLGYAREIVLQALEATTMNAANASDVMEKLTGGYGIPDNIQGVWTAEDDAALEDEKSFDFEIVEAKHGRKRVVERRDFLEYQREVRRELERNSSK